MAPGHSTEDRRDVKEAVRIAYIIGQSKVLSDRCANAQLTLVRVRYYRGKTRSILVLQDPLSRPLRVAPFFRGSATKAKGRDPNNRPPRVLCKRIHVADECVFLMFAG